MTYTYTFPRMRKIPTCVLVADYSTPGITPPTLLTLGRGDCELYVATDTRPTDYPGYTFYGAAINQVYNFEADL